MVRLMRKISAKTVCNPLQLAPSGFQFDFARRTIELSAAIVMRCLGTKVHGVRSSIRLGRTFSRLD